MAGKITVAAYSRRDNVTAREEMFWRQSRKPQLDEYDITAIKEHDLINNEFSLVNHFGLQYN